MRILPLAASLVLLAACGTPPQPQAAGQRPPPPEVTVVAAEARTTATSATIAGRVLAAATVEVRSRVAGAIDRVAFREGQLVQAGDLLVQIDPEPYRAAVARAEAEVAAAGARLAQAKREAARSGELLRAEAITPEAAEQRNAAVATGEAQLQAAQAALTAAKLDLDHAAIRAPIAGKVGRAEITAGNLVGVGTQVLTTLVSVDPVHVWFDLDERTFASARPLLQDATVQVGLDGEQGFPHAAKVDFIDNRIDPASGTIRIRASLANADGAIVPGAFARVLVPTSPAQPRVLVDERGIRTDQGQKVVLVLGQGDLVEQRKVALGDAVDGKRIVLEGVTAGEQVILTGKLVFPGMPVRPRQEAPAAPAAAEPAPKAEAAPTEPAPKAEPSPGAEPAAPAGPAPKAGAAPAAQPAAGADR